MFDAVARSAVGGFTIGTFHRRLQVREIGSQVSPYIEDLKKAEEAAKLAGRGLWTKVGLASCACLGLFQHASTYACACVHMHVHRRI